MKCEQERPLKRLKTDNTGGSGAEEVSSSDVKKTPSNANARYKAKKVGSGVFNTLAKPNGDRKKASSILAIKTEQEKRERAGLSHGIPNIIQLDSDVSLDDNSSPFKIVHSSQEFNIDSPNNKRLSQRLTSPMNQRTKHSSDDGIFWVRPARSRHENLERNNHALDGTNIEDGANRVPSSPLKDEASSVQGLPAALFDKEMKGLLDNFENPKVGNNIPGLHAANSNPKSPHNVFIDNPTHQVVASKSTFTESVLKSLGRKKHLKSKSRSSNHVNSNDSSVDLLGMLTQIGSTLMTNSPNTTDKTVVEISATRESPDATEPQTEENIILGESINKSNKTEKESGKLRHSEGANSTNTTSGDGFADDFDDDFDDDIDLDEVVRNATQTPILSVGMKVENVEGQASQLDFAVTSKAVDADDSFSDEDDDCLMDEILKNSTQTQTKATSKDEKGKNEDVFNNKPDLDTANLTKEVGQINLDISDSTETPRTKYKGLQIYEKDDSDTVNSKPFELFNESDNLARSALDFNGMKRLQIKEIRNGIHKSAGKINKQYILKCLASDDTFVNIMVRDHWASLDFQINDVIHVITTDPSGRFQLVDKERNLLIWHPDTLLSATRISDAVGCKRKSIISHKFQGTGIVVVPFILGNIAHSLFQQCLIHRRIDDEFIGEVIENELDSHIIEIYAAEKDKTEMKNMVMEHVSYIKDWIAEYVPMPNAESNSKYKKPSEFKATNILDIEENIASPIFGIRGLIDVVIEATLNDGSRFVVPMEIKTGREYLSNKAQVSLYTLLVKQRYNVESFYTTLVYTKLHQSYLTAVRANDLKMLINIRNELSQFLVYGVTELPGILQSASCERCFVLEECMVLNRLTENGTAEQSGIEVETYNALTDHLSSDLYREYYTKWDKLITKEEGLLNFAKTSVWRSNSREREENGGNCVGGLKLVKKDFDYSNGNYVYMFERDLAHHAPILSTQLSKNDRVIVSTDESAVGLASGYIKLLGSDFVVISTARNWSDSAIRMGEFDEFSNQKFRSVLKGSVSLEEKGESAYDIPEETMNKTFRIDKDQMVIGMAMARFNLLNLFLPSGDAKSRELVVELRKPKFSKTPLFKYSVGELDMNADQLKAIDTVSKIEDYCLILGMPGTGKTTVISAIVENIINNGMTVLISSYTHSAVDNICEKIIKNYQSRGEEKNLPLLRLGSTYNINPIVRPYSIYSEEFSNDIQNKNEFRDILDNCQIVAVTCLGIGDVVLGMNKRFDYCIIDEASQVSLPIVLGPIAFADKFILVGDHHQLPPLVINPEAKREGLDESLFQILSDSHPSSVIELTYQYRMCSDIMSLSNELIYEGRLKCGSPTVASQILNIPYLENLPINHTCIKDILDPERRVLFVNQDAIESFKEISIGDKIENPNEAKFISLLVKSMFVGGVPEADIGIMSFYKAQLKNFFVHLHQFSGLEILTADRFQGRDKKVIIISLVRSEVVGDLLKEWRRVNVAITRAKCKLIIFGSKKLLQKEKQFQGFIEMLGSNGWFYDLRPEDGTVFDDFSLLDNELQSSNHQTQKSDIKSLSSDSKVIRRTKILKQVMDHASG